MHFPIVTLTVDQAIALRARVVAHQTYVDEHCRDKKTGWASYKPEDHPAMPPSPSNEELGALEAYEFQRTNAAQWTAYLSSDGKHVTTFPGTKLARVTRLKAYKGRGFHGAYDMVAVVAESRDIKGNTVQWAGRGTGCGMLLRLKRMASPRVIPLRDRLPAPLVDAIRSTGREEHLDWPATSAVGMDCRRVARAAEAFIAKCITDAGVIDCAGLWAVVAHQCNVFAFA